MVLVTRRRRLHTREDRSGADGVHPDAVRRGLGGESLGERQDTRFRDGVGGYVMDPAQRRVRDDVDDDTSSLPAHHLGAGAGIAERGREVHLHEFTEDALGSFGQRRREDHRRARHEQVQAPPEERGGLRHAPVAVGPIRGVGSDERGPGGGGHRRAPLGVTATEGDLHPGLGEVLDDGAADPGGAAGDECGPAANLVAHCRTRTARSAASIPPSTDSAAPVLPAAASESR